MVTEKTADIRKKMIEILRNELPVLRAKARVSQGEIAEKIGISRQTYSSIETGKREMPWTTFLALLAYFQNNESTNQMIETKIIIDALQAANFVTEGKTEELVNKVANLAGTRKKVIMDANIVHFNNRKHTNEDIYENVATLEKALQGKKQASFYYFKLDENCEKVYQKEKKRYVVEPFALIFNEDNYYLMTWNSKYEDITTYRVDRMEEVAVEEEPIS